MFSGRDLRAIKLLNYENQNFGVYNFFSKNNFQYSK